MSCERDAGEGFAVNVATSANGSTLAGDVEVHLSGRFIEAMSPQKVQSGFGPAAPVVATGIVLQLRGRSEGLQHPAHTPLSPDGFVGIDECAIAVEAMQEAAVLVIKATGKPERQTIVEQQPTIHVSGFAATGGLHQQGGGQLRWGHRKFSVFSFQLVSAGFGHGPGQYGSGTNDHSDGDEREFVSDPVHKATDQR